MTCKRENNILCDSDGSHLSGQTQKTFLCSSASALSLPSSLGSFVKSSDAALSCRHGTDPLQLSQVSVSTPRGNGNNFKPFLSFPSRSDQHPGPGFLLRCQTVATEAGQGQKPTCCCSAVSALMAI